MSTWRRNVGMGDPDRRALLAGAVVALAGMLATSARAQNADDLKHFWDHDLCIRIVAAVASGEEAAFEPLLPTPSDYTPSLGSGLLTADDIQLFQRVYVSETRQAVLCSARDFRQYAENINFSWTTATRSYRATDRAITIEFSDGRRSLYLSCNVLRRLDRTTIGGGFLFWTFSPDEERAVRGWLYGDRADATENAAMAQTILSRHMSLRWYDHDGSFGRRPNSDNFGTWVLVLPSLRPDHVDSIRYMGDGMDWSMGVKDYDETEAGSLVFNRRRTPASCTQSAPAGGEGAEEWDLGPFTLVLAANEVSDLATRRSLVVKVDGRPVTVLRVKGDAMVFRQIPEAVRVEGSGSRKVTILFRDGIACEVTVGGKTYRSADGLLPQGPASQPASRPSRSSG